MDTEMKHVCVKSAFVTEYCGVSPLLKPDTVRHALRSCVKMDSWHMNQSKIVERDIGKSDAARSIVDGYPAEGKYKGEKISNGFPGIQFYLSASKRGRVSPMCPF
jgi:hypothetical protein